MRRTICGFPLLFALALPAQDMATIGRFVDGDGKPVAGATVTFATMPPDVFDAFAPPRVVDATTDDAGKFRVLLRQGAAHSAWAIGPANGAERWRSAVQEGVVAGSIVELRAAERSKTPAFRMPAIADLGAGPFTAEVRCQATHAPAHRLLLAADGSATLPELPAGGVFARLFGPDGKLVVAQLGGYGERRSFQPIVPRSVLVVDEQGKPVAGARVARITYGAVGAWGQMQFGLRALGDVVEGLPTDAEGRTTLRDADLPGPYFAWTDDRHARAAGREPNLIEDGELIPSKTAVGDGPIRLIARRGPVLHGKLRRGAQMLADRGVLVRTRVLCKHASGGGTSKTAFMVSQKTTTGNDGSFTVPGVPRPVGSMQLSFDTGDELPTLLLARTDVPAAPLDIDLALWPVVTWQLRAADAVPPPAARFLLWPADPEREPAEAIVLVGDRAGRVRVRVEPGAWFVYATDGAGHGYGIHTAAIGAAATVELPLSPLQRQSGRVVDADGKPVADAVFQCNGWSSDRAPQLEGQERLLERYFGVINRGLVGNCRSDADGRFDARFVAPTAYVPTGMVSGPGGSGQRQVHYVPRTDVEIRLEK